MNAEEEGNQRAVYQPCAASLHCVCITSCTPLHGAVYQILRDALVTKSGVLFSAVYFKIIDRLNASSYLEAILQPRLWPDEVQFRVSLLRLCHISM
jgi:hypothetical protein